MKVEVVNRFIDKGTKQLREVGETFDVTEARFKEISAAGKYVRLLPDDGGKPASKGKKKAAED